MSALSVSDPARATVLVAIPVFNAAAALARCLERLTAVPLRARWRALVIDDASTDPAVIELGRRVARSGERVAPIQFRRNRSNRGFTANVNQAIDALWPGEHLLLLNSDTVVTRGWLDEMLATAAEPSHAPVGTVTPFSNNATICSLPDFTRAWPLPSRVEAERIAQLLASKRAAAIDLPTGVGFCLLITRPCLEAVGRFDETAFPRGYGEENDFCRRAAAAGFRNVLCPNAFVGHEGAVSFGDEREQLMRAGAQALLAKHPDYNDLVAAWIARDPAASRRAWIRAELGLK
ncbi:MAG: glycosyltransferase [Casimicrobiaceae bacterium]|nr:glycosyltransferase [Casimicrobiaceae bacterium]